MPNEEKIISEEIDILEDVNQGTLPHSEEPETIENPAMLDNILWRIGQIDKKIAERKAYVKSVYEFVDAEIIKLNEYRKWHEKSCELFLQANNKKSIKLVNGSCQFRTFQKIHWIEDDELLVWIKKNKLNMIRIKESPDKKALTSHIKETGEVPDGVEFESKTSFTVKTNLR